MANTTKHDTRDICPRCEITFLVHIHCANGACTFCIHVCERCDNPHAVNAFVADHQRKDCKHVPATQPVAA